MLVPEGYQDTGVSMTNATSRSNPVASWPSSGRGRLGIVELFAGIGCVARGFERTGVFETILLTDNDVDACDTYAHNCSAGARYLRRGVQYLRASEILDIAAGRPIVGLLGCPPCRGFSAAGLRDPDDERNLLLRHYFRLVKAIEPGFLLMENVPRVLEYDLFKEMLREIGDTYRLWKGVLNAALFGVPQTGSVPSSLVTIATWG